MRAEERSNNTAEADPRMRAVQAMKNYEEAEALDTGMIRHNSLELNSYQRDQRMSLALLEQPK